MTASSAGEPLRIGILGAARIAPLSIVSPAQATGTRLVAVAARDRSRAADFAAENGVERVVESYAALLADPEVEVVYNPLANGLHAPWNAKIAAAGKHVLTEKPSAANAAEARDVAAAVREAGTVLMEAFHYPYHPLFQRACELIAQGAIGEVRHIDVPLLMPDPGADDPRWRLDLAGGSTMDLGCYSLSCLALLGERFCGGAFTVSEAVAAERAGHPGVDSHLFVAGAFPSGATGSGGSDMDADDWSFTLVVTGSEGEIVVPSFPLPHQDDRLILRHTASTARARRSPQDAADLVAERDGDVVEKLGNRSSYTFQLEAFTAAVRDGAPVTTDADFAVRNMTLVDAAYAAAGLPARQSISPG
ncbi:MAG: Gfo/Idh/MocA family oxidoreductase [Tetrasphaera sp.]